MFKLGAVSLARSSATVGQVNRTWRAREARLVHDPRSWLVAVTLVLAVALLGAASFAASGDGSAPGPAVVDGTAGLVDGATTPAGAPADTMARVAIGTESTLGSIPQNTFAGAVARARAGARLWLLSLLGLAALAAAQVSWPRAERRKRNETHADLLVLLPGRRGPPTRH